jgi:FAD/FMN-containing dehydrogenase
MMRRVCLQFCLSILLSINIFYPSSALRASGCSKEPCLDDQSHFNKTAIYRLVDLPSNMADAEQVLKTVLVEAKNRKIPVSIAGARHSMGGQSLAPGGLVINMLPLHRMKFDSASATLHVEAGALWSEVIPYLNGLGASVKIMQSNNPFTVGGTLSVNAHGWVHGQPPIAATVQSLRLMNANGQILQCSRTENPELFSLVLGGYGLFGVILDADLVTVPNTDYQLNHVVLKAEDYANQFAIKAKREPPVALAFGRLNVQPGKKTFLKEAILYLFREVNGPHDPAKLRSRSLDKAARILFRATVGSSAAKKIRWSGEKWLSKKMEGRLFNRNDLLNQGIEVFANKSKYSTDILNEYFVPQSQLETFLEAARDIIPRYDGNLLNVTIRDLMPDNDSFLKYADQQMFSLVMLFNVKLIEAEDDRMKAMTRELIDAALKVGGRYYLPYRLHATKEQFAKAYPQSSKFFELKLKYDSGQIFRNYFWNTYGSVQ